jgi:hypothetical protein
MVADLRFVNHRYMSSNSRHNTPTRAPTYFDLVYDALATNPKRLSANNIFEWLREHRTQNFQECHEKKLRMAIQGTLSAQSNRQQPTVWKYKDDGSEGLGTSGD